MHPDFRNTQSAESHISFNDSAGPGQLPTGTREKHARPLRHRRVQTRPGHSTSAATLGAGGLAVTLELGDDGRHDVRYLPYSTCVDEL
jgi:hypothetical protein